MPEPVLVLGASGGIGSVIARRLVASGHDVIVHGRDKARLIELASSLGSTASVEIADLTTQSDVDALFSRLRDRCQLGGVVFSIATALKYKLTHRTPWSTFDHQLQTQLKALHLSATAAFRSLADSSTTRRFVVVSTELSLSAAPIKTAPYAAAKAALTAYAQVIAKEWLARGIRVHIVAPGLVKTPLVADMPDEFINEIAAGMPERRLTSTEDIAGVVAFLMTDAADTLYGTPIRVSRGERL